MSQNECRTALLEALAQLEGLKCQDLASSDVQHVISNVFWDASKNINEDEDPQLKQWLEDCSGALAHMGRMGSSLDHTRYGRFLNKNLYVLRKIVGVAKP